MERPGVYLHNKILAEGPRSIIDDIMCWPRQVEVIFITLHRLTCTQHALATPGGMLHSQTGNPSFNIRVVNQFDKPSCHLPLTPPAQNHEGKVDADKIITKLYDFDDYANELLIGNDDESYHPHTRQSYPYYGAMGKSY